MPREPVKYQWWKIPTPLTKADLGENNGSGRYCSTCGRRISEHKQKIFKNWICDLVLMSNGSWVHSSREFELVQKENLHVVDRLYQQ